VSPVRETPGQAIEQLSTRVAYQTPYLRMREDQIRRPDGSDGIYSYVEFPQGTLPGMAAADDPEYLAREELRQETGITASQMRHLGHLYCASGMSSQGFDVFLATGLTPGTAELELEEQDLVHRWFPRAEVEDMIRTGVITDDSSVAAYTLLLLSETIGGGTT
jgi:8-oxo-dGDP phosphatase